MTRINELRNVATNSLGNINALIFGAVLIICSVTVGCSSEKPKPVTSSNQTPITQPQAQPQPVPARIVQADSKPAPKKPVVRKKPATVNYTDKTYGVTFEYPRRYAIETGNAAADLLLSSPMPMNFVQPGGVALAAVELPETSFANTDFSSAFFNVSVHKELTSDQCNEFAVPQPKMSPKSEAVATEAANDPTLKPDTPSQPSTESMKDAKASPSSDAGPKLIIGDMELRATEAVNGEGTRQSDSKYFHIYQNGACYEFGLNVTTVASEQGVTKHVDRDKVFSRLEQILSTVKINPLTPEVSAEAAPPTVAATPAQ
jgi:hypothetical protein